MFFFFYIWVGFLWHRYLVRLLEAYQTGVKFNDGLRILTDGLSTWGLKFGLHFAVLGSKSVDVTVSDFELLRTPTYSRQARKTQEV